ncbi:hypothetical protein B9Z55_025593 [Caenorhabditis nigoni]|uniref:NR LBD domain-containing protein n=1 Tax=Caenorhabditis nigoni TaxID=1611254 RepID=A0A2G5SZN8_9PELO|nr:hypothetical protein B9Z55_025593 [Caenorhabditis nigoni]
MEIAGPQPLNMTEHELHRLDNYLNILNRDMAILAADPECPPELWDFFEEIAMLAVRLWNVGNEPFTHHGVELVQQLNGAVNQRYALLLRLAFF